MTDQPTPQLRGPMPFRAMMDEAMRLTRRFFLFIFPWVAGPMIVAGIVLVVVQAPLTRQMLQPTMSPQVSDLGSLFTSWLALVGLSIVYMVLYWFASNVALVGTVHAVWGLPVEMGSAWLWVLRPRILGTLLLCSLSILAGAAFCILPGYLVAVLLGLVVPVMVLEGSTGTAAIRRATRLILYNPQQRLTTLPFARLLVILLAGGLISYAVGLTLGLPFGLAQQVMIWRSLSGGQGPPDVSVLTSTSWLWLQVPQVILTTAGRYAVAVYVSFCVALFYLDLRYRSEGGDLEQALDQAGAPLATTAPELATGPQADPPARQE